MVWIVDDCELTNVNYCFCRISEKVSAILRREEGVELGGKRCDSKMWSIPITM